jgi:hypothetical protein
MSHDMQPRHLHDFVSHEVDDANEAQLRSALTSRSEKGKSDGVHGPAILSTCSRALISAV